jgi:Na+-driven multidrug efflux pump
MGIAISAGASVLVGSSSGEKAFGRAKASIRQLPDPRGKKKISPQ